MRRQLVVVNARAARGTAKLHAIEAAASGRADVVVTADVAEVERELRSRADRGVKPEVVVFVGGDGTHMAGVSAVTRVFGGDLPKMALACGGTVNTTARTWGSSGNAARDVTRALAGANVVPRATLAIADDEGRALVGFIFGTGLVARFFELYDARGGGLAVSLALTARLVVGAAFGTSLAKRVMSPMRATIEIDGEPAKGTAWSLVVASVHENLGLGFRVTYRAREREDRVHVVASTASVATLARLYPRTLMGRGFDRNEDVDALAARTVVRFKEPSPYVLDGDTFVAREIAITPGPKLPILDLSR